MFYSLNFYLFHDISVIFKVMHIEPRINVKTLNYLNFFIEDGHTFIFMFIASSRHRNRPLKIWVMKTSYLVLTRINLIDFALETNYSILSYEDLNFTIIHQVYTKTTQRNGYSWRFSRYVHQVCTGPLN